MSRTRDITVWTLVLVHTLEGVEGKGVDTS